jgi:hypothetical protein
MRRQLQCLFTCFAVCSAAVAAEPPKPAERSTDDALRDSLDSHAGNDYDRALLGDPGKSITKDRRKQDMEEKLKHELGPAAQWEDQPADALRQAANGMRDAQTRLAQGKSDAITQQVQRQVIANLEKEIDEAKKSCQSAGSTDMPPARKPTGKANGNPNRPTDRGSKAASERPARASDPNVDRTPKQAANEQKRLALQRMREQYEISLQAHPHETMFEGPSEYFLPDYEREIEDYFRRLSSGKPVEEKP